MSQTKSKQEPTIFGEKRYFVQLTDTILEVGETARKIILAECGATITLDGYVRQWTKGRETLFLEYSAYEEMAKSEMAKLCESALERYEISSIVIVHRLGKLEIGETSVVISVGAPHRKSAFEACSWAITELKRTVPIWKKEIYADGEAWVEGEKYL